MLVLALVLVLAVAQALVPVPLPAPMNGGARLAAGTFWCGRSDEVEEATVAVVPASDACWCILVVGLVGRYGLLDDNGTAVPEPCLLAPVRLVPGTISCPERSCPSFRSRSTGEEHAAGAGACVGAEWLEWLEWYE